MSESFSVLICSEQVPKNAEGYWGFPHLKLEKFVGFTKFPFHIVLIDMKFISKISKNMSKGSSSFPVQVFGISSCQDFKVSNFKCTISNFDLSFSSLQDFKF